MKDEIIPKQDHISRYCAPSKIKEDGTPSGEAFMLRTDNGERELSVHWLEFFDEDSKDKQIDQIKNTVGRKPAKNGKFAVTNIGIMIDYVKTESESASILSVSHDPIDTDEAHSLVNNIYPDHDMISELLADVFDEYYPSR